MVSKVSPEVDASAEDESEPARRFLALLHHQRDQINLRSRCKALSPGFRAVKGSLGTQGSRSRGTGADLALVAVLRLEAAVGGLLVLEADAGQHHLRVLDRRRHGVHGGALHVLQVEPRLVPARLQLVYDRQNKPTFASKVKGVRSNILIVLTSKQ